MKKLSRRKIFQTLGFVGGIALAKGCGNLNLGTASANDAENLKADTNACILFPEQTEGPYYLDLNLLRKDVTEGKPGVPLRLSLRVVDFPGCTSISNAVVDI